MGALKKRGQVWWIRYSRGGKRYEESSGSARREDASTLLKLREGDTARGVPITPKVGRTIFEEAAADFLREYETNKRKSVALARIHVAHLKGFFAGRRMAHITTADVREYQGRRQAQGIANGTINREVAALGRMFTLLVQSGKLFVRPYLPKLKEAAPRAGFVEAHQLATILRHLPEEAADLALFAYITGWRWKSEVAKLRWKNVSFETDEVRLDPGASKTGAARVFPFTDELRALLERRRATVRHHEQRLGRVMPFVFCWDDGSPIKDFRASWANACTQAGLPGRVLHDCRRSAIRNMVQRGVPERVAMQLAGHKTRTVFDRYAIVSQGDLRAAASKLDGVAQSDPQTGPGRRRDGGTGGMA